MVRRNREFFRLMDETGLSADQLRSALATRDALGRLVCEQWFAAVDRTMESVQEAARVVSDAITEAFGRMSSVIDAIAEAQKEENRRKVVDE
jgi:hypothetical protein